ncbi:restriction endonuclease subunit S [Shewanella sp. SM101]|uniref:restriction endonuclease subunit S n=1 Tax=Shewanella sp. SM101 TaxID=2912789 RepID=UPI0021DA43CE|nr:restriction endonuclease subunit S [Shewanella sp. SM101]MCU8106469.1 restriction endonuclease subunit S [Shewanella sp. SM101]
MTGRYKEYPEYKESGVEWLENIPAHWSSKSLKFLCTYNDDVIYETTDPETIIEYVDIGSVSAVEGISKTEKVAFGKSPSRARRIVRNGDVIVSTVRTYLEAIAPITNPPENMIVSTGFAVIRPNSKLDKGFAAYCLRAKGFIREVVARSVGISYPAINATELVGISVPYLPYEEQQKIANFLDHETAKIDTLIDKQEKLIELLKEKRQAVISHAVTKGISYKGQPNAPMKDSGVEWLGEVPEHWVKIAFKKVIKTRKGVAFSTSDFCDNGVRVVKASDIKLLSLRQSDVFLPINFIKKYPKAYLTQGNIILSTVGSSPDVKNSAVGQIAMVPKELDNTLLNQNTVVFEPIDKKIDRDYLFFLLQTTAYRDHLDLHAHGTANQASLNVADMLNFKCFTPPLNEQKHIAVHLYKFLEIVSTLETRVINAIQLMQERKTALISAAVTGNIDVRDWTASGEV